jgi:small-conductance mechanosensitive channel
MNYRTMLSKFPFLEWHYHRVTIGSLFIFVLAASAAFVALRWLRRAFIRRLERSVGRTATTLDDLALALARRTNLVFLLAVSMYVGSRALSLQQGTTTSLRLVLLAVALWQVGLWAHQVIDYAIEQLTRHQAGEDAGIQTAAGALSFVGRVAVWSVLVLVLLSNLNVNVTTLVAGLGIGGIAVALALQNVLGDLFASLSILLDKPFAVGHFVVIDDIAGTISHVGLKSTRVRSLSGEEIVLANAELLKTRIHNYKRLLERRVLFGFGVTYDTGHEKLVAIPSAVREIVESVPKTRFDRAHFKEYGDSSLNFEVVFFVLDPDYNIYMDTQQAINLGIYQRFEQDGIEFAFPTRTLYVSRTDLTPARSPGDSPPDSADERSASRGDDQKNRNPSPRSGGQGG